jgi:hypothetical protein
VNFTNSRGLVPSVVVGLIDAFLIGNIVTVFSSVAVGVAAFLVSLVLIGYSPYRFPNVRCLVGSVLLTLGISASARSHNRGIPDVRVWPFSRTHWSRCLWNLSSSSGADSRSSWRLAHQSRRPSRTCQGGTNDEECGSILLLPFMRSTNHKSGELL